MVGDENEIVLDLNSFFTLASKTRVSILKLLDLKNMTVSEVARSENLAKSTAHEHLAKLCNSGFVKKVDNGHKWTYYELTESGKVLLHPEDDKKILILLSSLSLSFFTGCASFYTFAKNYFSVSEYPPAEGNCEISFFLLLSILFIALSAALFFLFVSYVCNYRQSN